MKYALSNLQLCIIGSPDFLRRMSAAARQIPQGTAGHSSFAGLNMNVLTANLAESRAVIFGERPQILLFDVGLKTTKRDLIWLRALLNQVRDRIKRDISVIMAVTAAEKFAFAGDLFFESDNSLNPSGLIDNLLITPPPGIPSAPSLEDQLRDALGYFAEVIRTNEQGRNDLPALWDDCWVPVMCDPESRNVWMRWLPRYAKYVNENPIIVGETGSGKTRLAAAMHRLSGRSGPFISITPRDFSSTELVQAELFGAVSGAYTGAVEKWGLVRKAERGTLFIDELQSIDRDLQGKLITFIENKSYRRVGEAESHTADVRFIFATNRPLQELVENGSLRDDFAYRLERLQIELAPLHRRRLDIAAAICFALAKVHRERALARSSRSQRSGLGSVRQVDGLLPSAYQVLFSASWPGNLRQLENTIAKLVELSDIKDQRLIDRESACQTMESLLGHVTINSTDIFEQAAVDVAIRARAKGYDSLSDCMFDLAEKARSEALEVSGGDVKRAASLINDSQKAMQFFSISRAHAF